jgi:hypothetical protein
VGLATALAGFVALLGCGGREDASSTGSSSLPPLTSLAQGTRPEPPPSTPESTATSPTSEPTGTFSPPGTTGGSSPASTAPTGGTQPPPDSPGGFSVEYPEGWGPGGQVQATAFAGGATCGSALIVDRALPADSGPGASIEQSFVQVCWRGLENKTLAQFMAATYGSAGGFQPTTLAGRPAFVSRAGTSSTFFVDTSTNRYQVVTGVAASDQLRATRLAQVERILASLSLPN